MNTKCTQRYFLCYFCWSFKFSGVCWIKGHYRLCFCFLVKNSRLDTFELVAKLFLFGRFLNSLTIFSSITRNSFQRINGHRYWLASPLVISISELSKGKCRIMAWKEKVWVNCPITPKTLCDFWLYVKVDRFNLWDCSSSIYKLFTGANCLIYIT